MNIIYSDCDLAVVIKPIGLDSESAVPAAIIAELGGECHTVHRLDLNVGGVMVYARTKQAAAALSRAIQDGRLIKEYVARVHGVPEEKGDWTDLLFKDSRKNKVFVVKRERAGVKKARLEYTRIGTDGETSLVHIRLHTGRSHQIRVQFASRGYPLLGDHKYGARDAATAPQLFSCALTIPWKGANLLFTRLPDWAEEDRIDPVAALNAAFRTHCDATASLTAALAHDRLTADPASLLNIIERYQAADTDLTRLVRRYVMAPPCFRPSEFPLRRNEDGSVPGLPRDAFAQIDQRRRTVQEAVRHLLDILNSDPALLSAPQYSAIRETAQHILGGKGKPIRKPEAHSDENKPD